MDGILFLGDWTDYATLDPITATYSNRMIETLKDTGLTVLFLEGNHCLEDEESNFTVLGAAKEFEHDYSDVSFVFKKEEVDFREVVDDPIKYPLGPHGALTAVFHCFPYKSDYDALEEEIAEANEKLDDKLINIMLFHFPTVNALLDNGLQSMGGVNLSEEITDNFDVVIGGDFHKPQTLINNPNAFYVGAPFDLKFNQQGPRKVSIITIDDRGKYRVKDFPNPYNYQIISRTREELFDMDFSNAARTILKVKDYLSPEEKEEIKSVGFYRVMFSSGKAAKPVDLEVLTIDPLVDDKTTFTQELAKFELDSETTKRALQIYEGICKAGE